MKRTVFFVSDSTGITAETLGKALLAQFDGLEYRQVTIPFVAEVARAEEAVEQINAAAREDACPPIVFSTLADARLSATMARSNSRLLDLFSAFIHPLEIEFNEASSHARGRFHGLTDRASYDGRIEAVDFALSHDDGASIRHYRDADIILVGVSRVGKTPTCVYLAMQFGIRAANYPLTEDDLVGDLLPECLREYRARLFGLTIEPERLQRIRTERRPDSRYASLAQCRKEVREAVALLERARVAMLDTSTLSIEEIASRVLLKAGLRRKSY